MFNCFKNILHLSNINVIRKILILYNFLGKYKISILYILQIIENKQT